MLLTQSCCIRLTMGHLQRMRTVTFKDCRKVMLNSFQRRHHRLYDSRAWFFTSIHVR